MLMYRESLTNDQSEAFAFYCITNPTHKQRIRFSLAISYRKPTPGLYFLNAA